LREEHLPFFGIAQARKFIMAKITARQRLTAIGIAIAGFVGAAAAVAGNIGTISDAISKVTGLFGGSPAAISMNVEDYFVSARVDSTLTTSLMVVVSNSGDKSATNCKGQLIVKAGGWQNEYLGSNGYFLYTAANSTAGPQTAVPFETKPLTLPGHTQVRIEFLFGVPENDAQLPTTYNVLCDNIVASGTQLKLTNNLSK
jgi:hypothetical protein